MQSFGHSCGEVEKVVGIAANSGFYLTFNNKDYLLSDKNNNLCAPKVDDYKQFIE